MRWIVGGRAVTDQAASTSQMGRFETEAMTSAENLTALADLSGRWIDRVQTRRARTALVLDIDSSVSPTYGAQEGTAYNGHFACTCYHPLFVFNQDGDLERCALRPGNVHSAHGWREVLDPVVARYRGQALRRLLRGDAAFALPDVYEYLVRSPRSGRRSYPGATRRQASDPNLVARSQKSLANWLPGGLWAHPEGDRPRPSGKYRNKRVGRRACGAVAPCRRIGASHRSM